MELKTSCAFPFRGISSCWVSITATGQSHSTVLPDFPRGSQRQGDNLWSIW
ncbi:hypothetical protein FQN60_016018, partial [Etheostoma spectabile]